MSTIATVATRRHLRKVPSDALAHRRHKSAEQKGGGRKYENEIVLAERESW